MDVAPSLKRIQKRYIKKLNPTIPSVVIEVRANMLISGKYFTEALDPQAKNVTANKPIINPKLNFTFVRVFSIITMLPIITSVKPRMNFFVIRLLSKSISRKIAAKGIRAAAKAAVNVVVKTCVITRRTEPNPYPIAPIIKPRDQLTKEMVSKPSFKIQIDKIRINAIMFLTNTTEIKPQSFKSISRAGKPMANERTANAQVIFDTSIFL